MIKIDTNTASRELLEAWNNRERVLSDPSLYGRTPEWSRSGCQFGEISMPVGLILKCWMDGGAFVLPDGRRIFSFGGSALSGHCIGWAINLKTGKLSSFEGMPCATFHKLIAARQKALSEGKAVSESAQ